MAMNVTALVLANSRSTLKPPTVTLCVEVDSFSRCVEGAGAAGLSGGVLGDQHQSGPRRGGRASGAAGQEGKDGQSGGPGRCASQTAGRDER